MGLFFLWAALLLIPLLPGRAASGPNLVPFTPPGWSAPITVTTTAGSRLDSSPLLSSDRFFISWAIANTGDAATAVDFKVSLSVDGTAVETWTLGALQPGYGYTPTYLKHSLSAGSHTIQLVADSEANVAETSEADNTYSKAITVTQAFPEIRIDPESLDFPEGLSATGLKAPSGTFEPVAVSSALPLADSAPAVQGQVIPANKLLEAAIIQESLANTARARVKVRLKAPGTILSGADLRRKDTVSAFEAEIQDRQQEVIDSVPSQDLSVRERFQRLSAFSAEVTPEGLQALQGDPRVEAIEPVHSLQAHMAQGLKRLHGFPFRATYSGTNVSIAICDTGIDYTHPRLGGGSFPNSKVVGGYNLGDTGSPAPSPMDANGHGTACAGIAAGNLGTQEDYVGGVAYGANLYALKITEGASATADDDKLITAWEWCVENQYHKPDAPILVISTSFGGEKFGSACDSSFSLLANAANNAANAGITILASSGNNGYCDAIATPACLSKVVAVGAVYDSAFGNVGWYVDSTSCIPDKYADGPFWVAEDSTAPDKVTAYSNMSPLVRLLAPADEAYTTDITGAGGYNDAGDYTSAFGGTSAACPYAAGVVACLQSAALQQTGQYLTVDQVIATLTSTGDPITDTKVNITKPRVNLEQALLTLPTSGQRFRIYNDGPGLLTVNPLSFQVETPWLAFTPATGLEIPGGEYQYVTVTANLSEARAGESTALLSVSSNDSDESPYPTGVYINTLNSPPTISEIPDQSVLPGTATGPIPFTVSDVETPASSLLVTVASSNPTLVPTGNIFLAGTASDRTIMAIPAMGRTGTTVISVSVQDGEGVNETVELFTLTVSARVVGRYIFYNQSAFDGNNAAATAADDGAIATDKSALLPGQTATFANYTSYSRGINGIMIDIAGLIATPQASDFAFEVSNSQNPPVWSAAPASPTISVRSGAGTSGSSRITLIWANNVIQKRWLRVTAKPTSNTGLTANDVFYFGNAIGESGNVVLDAEVTAADVLKVRSNPRQKPLNPAAITFPYDFDRDGNVGASDALIARSNPTSVLTSLKLLTAPAP